MLHRHHCLLAFFSLALTTTLRAQDFQVLLKEVASADAARRTSIFNEIDNAVAHATRPGAESDRSIMEKKLLTALTEAQHDDATLWVLRQLERAGSDDAVPALAKALAASSAPVREAARMALHAIPGDASLMALQNALKKPVDAQQAAGLLYSLGERKDRASIPGMIRAAQSNDPALITAGLLALGQIPHADAVKPLARLAAVVPPDLADHAYSALLNNPAAAELISPERWIAEWSKKKPHIAAAALRLATAKQDKTALRLLLAQVDSEHVIVRQAACELLAVHPSPEVTQAILERLKTSTDSTRLAWLQTLLQRRDPAALPVLLRLMQSENPDIALAATTGVANLNSVEAVRELAVTASNASPASATAREALARLRGAEVNTALLGLLDQDIPVRLEAIRALGLRRASETSEALLAHAKNASEDVVDAIIEAVAAMAGPEYFARVVDLATTAKDPKVWRQNLRHLKSMTLRLGEAGNEQFDVVVARMSSMQDETRTRMTALLADFKTPAALSSLKDALKSDSDALVQESLKAISAWRAAEALPHLLDIMNSEATPARLKTVAANAAVGSLKQAPGQEIGSYLSAAETIWKSTTASGVRLSLIQALSVWADPAAVVFLRDRLNEEGFATEIALAISQILNDLATQAPALMRDPGIPAPPIDTPARALWDSAMTLAASQTGWLRTWSISPVYEGGDPFSTPYAPEQNKPVTWTPAPAMALLPSPPGALNFLQIKQGDNLAIYTEASYFAEQETTARLELGSDDGVKVWLNGNLVHEKNAARPVRAGEDKVDISLKQGRNVFRFKVRQGSGDWGLCAQVIETNP